jgi:beta-galactosidase/beta-glucuronidase
MAELDVPAGGEMEFTLPYHLPAAPGKVEYWLNLSLPLKNDQLWAPRGFELAWAQFLLPVEAQPAKTKPVVDLPALVYERDHHTMTVRGDEFELDFNMARGVIDRFDYHGLLLLIKGPKLNL